jgi:hypothetical protein
MPRYRSWLLSGPTVLVLCWLLCPQTAQAAWPHSPYANLPVSTASNRQEAPQIVSDGAGGAIVTWHDYRSGGNYDIYAHHVTAAGLADPTWPPDGVPVCTAINNQYAPQLISDGAGGAIITWQDPRGGGSGDIYAQHVLASGVMDPGWPAGGVSVCTAVDDQSDPQLVSDGAGGAIITWEDYRSGADYDIYAQHVLESGVVDPGWPADGVALCTAANDQSAPQLISDYAGGAIVTWSDERSGVGHIYAQRVTAAGVADPDWIADGVALCTAVNGQDRPQLATDGAGGAIVAWEDLRDGMWYDIYAQRVTEAGVIVWTPDGIAVSAATDHQYSPQLISDDALGAIVTWADRRDGDDDIYAQRLTASGAVHPSWPAGGLAVCDYASFQNTPQLVSDGAGGAIITWQDLRTGTNDDVYAQHVTAAGATDWTADGVALSTPSGDQEYPQLVSDGAGGAIVAWDDLRGGGANHDIYAQRVARFGYPGTPEAEIESVRDVPNDQGGTVKLSWYPSYLDTENDPNLHCYEIYRSVPPNYMAAGLARGARLLESPAEVVEKGTEAFLTAVLGTMVYAWEYVDTQYPRHYLPVYGYLAPTTGDSTGAYNPLTVFMIVARDSTGSKYWLSLPDSGYSADNLAPATPAPFTGEYASGTATLHWGASTEADFAEYRLHRGSTADFTPGPGNLVTAQPDTGYVDYAGGPYHYKLCAVDVHGNLSPYTHLLPSGALDVPGAGLPRQVWLARPSPNPMREGCAIRFGLPQAARVSLAVYDQQGRRVRMLVDASMSAGEHMAPWDGCDAAGRLAPSGLYLVRMAAGERVLTTRAAVVR